MASAAADTVMSSDIDTDTTNDEILLAATNHDLDALRTLFKTGSARIKDPDTGFSPLHAAIAACEDDDEDHSMNDEGDAVHSNALSEESALATVQLLFENGAIWNELDNNDETPGCVALRLGLKKVYEAVVAAGVRAELLFGRLDAYQLLAGDEEEDEDDGEGDDDAIDGFEPTPSGAAPGANETSQSMTAQNVEGLSGFDPVPNPSNKVDSASNGDAGQEVPEVIQIDEAGQQTTAESGLSNPNVNNEDYLRSKLTYSEGRLLDSDKNAVMMDWETEIMKNSADQLCTGPGLRTMNIGHGMGIVDTMFLANNPSMHHIIEAHPAVIEHMKETGWFEKPNVTVHQGRWQDILPGLVKQGVVLDAMYYDTYAEDYSDLKELFQEHVVGLLDAEGKFGFYNGLGADRQVCYDVYTKVVELDLFDAGLDVEWTTLDVPDLAHSWDGIRRPYWVVDVYRLPTCHFVKS
jgi:protein arginine N-methyltransferase 2